jgi:hypothetical protein
MSREDLLKMLRDAGLDDEAIKGLLKDALDSLDMHMEDDGKVDEKEKEDAEEAGRLLGVDL